MNFKHSTGKLITAPAESNEETKISGIGRVAESSMLRKVAFASPGHILYRMVIEDGLYSSFWGGGKRDVYY